MSIFQRYRLARDPGVTVANLVDELMRRKGDCEVGVHETGPFLLSALHARICAIAAFLHRSLSLHPGQPVAIYRSNDRNCFHWFLAIIRAGGIAVPLNPLLSLAEVSRILSESGTQILVTDRVVFERSIGDRQALDVRVWIQADDEEETLDGFLRVSETPGAPLPPAHIDPAATVAIFHTSGTSGFPKGAALSSNALLGARASTVLSGIFLGPRDLALIALPWSHIMAVSIALYGLMAGIRGCFLDRFDIEIVLDLMERFRMTAMVGVPTMFARLVNSNPPPERLASVRVWLSASDHLPTEVRRRLRQFGALYRLPGGVRIPPVLLNGYGMVELGGLAMMGIEVPLCPGSGDLCLPVPPFRIRIVDDKGRTLPAGAVGECQIRRRGLAPHYWKDKGDSQGLLTGDGWLRTGDLATRNRLGLIRLVGRSKDVIKSGGYSVYVRELEEALLAHPGIARAVAFGLPHNEKGEIPVAAVELHAGSPCGEVDLLAWCRSKLAPYKAPRRIWILTPGDLPQNHGGKFLRRVLQERFSGQGDGVSAAPALAISPREPMTVSGELAPK